MTTPKKKNVKKKTAKKKKTVKTKAVLIPNYTTASENDNIETLTEKNRQLKRKIFDLYTIFEISRNFNTVLEFNQLLDTFIFTSLAQVSASKAAIYLENQHNSEIYVMSKHRGSGDKPHGNIRFKGKTKLLSYITKLNRPTSTEEVLGGMADKSEQKILKHFHPGLVVPLIYQKHLSGIFLISDKISDRPFTNDDIEFLSVLASQITVAIENTRLYESEKIASQQLLQAQQQLLQSERLAALGEMSAKVAHEVNNPLGIIKNYLHLINKNIENDPESKEYTEIIGGEINRIAQIVRELLDFHRPHPVVYSRVDICGLMKESLQLMERQLSTKKIEIVKHEVPDCPPIEAIADNLKQVFLNLIINASDAMSDNGTLEVSIEFDDKFVFIIIKDTGPGIPPDIIPHLFEPFFTTKEDGKSTGLGLSVCYGIIKKHNGSITFKNHKNGGCFTVKLPINQPKKKYDTKI